MTITMIITICPRVIAATARTAARPRRITPIGRADSSRTDLPAVSRRHLAAEPPWVRPQQQEDGRRRRAVEQDGGAVRPGQLGPPTRGRRQTTGRHQKRTGDRPDGAPQHDRRDGPGAQLGRMDFAGGESAQPDGRSTDADQGQPQQEDRQRGQDERQTGDGRAHQPEGETGGQASPPTDAIEGLSPQRRSQGRADQDRRRRNAGPGRPAAQIGADDGIDRRRGDRRRAGKAHRREQDPADSARRRGESRGLEFGGRQG